MWRGWPGSRSPRSPAPFGVWTGSPPRPASACCGWRRTCTTSPPPPPTSLASGRTRVVGGRRAVPHPLVLRDPRQRASRRACGPVGHHVILFDLEDDTYDQRLPLSQNMLWKRVDGVITLNIPMDERGGRASSTASACPLVAIGLPSARPLACVRIDDRAAMRTAVDHLAGLGHTEIGYIGAVPTNVAHIQTPQDRLEAFVAAVGGPRADLRRRLGRSARTGRPRRPRATAPSRSSPGEPADRDRRGLRRDGHRGARERPAARACGCPRTSSIIGIDDYVLSGRPRPDDGAPGRRRLRARRRRAAAARRCSTTTQSTDEIVLPTELVVRESTGPVRRRTGIRLTEPGACRQPSVPRRVVARELLRVAQVGLLAAKNAPVGDPGERPQHHADAEQPRGDRVLDRVAPGDRRDEEAAGERADARAGRWA